jgi:hypothetical protein
MNGLFEIELLNIKDVIAAACSSYYCYRDALDHKNGYPAYHAKKYKKWKAILTEACQGTNFTPQQIATLIVKHFKTEVNSATGGYPNSKMVKTFKAALNGEIKSVKAKIKPTLNWYHKKTKI